MTASNSHLLMNVAIRIIAILSKVLFQIWTTALKPLFCRPLRPDIGSVVIFLLLILLFIKSLGWIGLFEKRGMNMEFLPAPGVGLKISYDSPSGHESLTTISVAASRMASPTGIQLRPGDKLRIFASGAICTDSFYNWLEKIPTPNDIPKELTNQTAQLEWRLSYNPSWRNPEGERRFNLKDESFSGDVKLHHAHERHKLLPRISYGCLLGFVMEGVNTDEDHDILRAVIKEHRENNGMHIFPIGKEEVVNWDEKRHELRFEKHPHAPINMKTDQGRLVLLINDVVFSKETLDDLISVANKFKDKPSADSYVLCRELFGTRLAQSFTNDKISFEEFVSELWYFDNKGTFSVVIEKTGY